MRPLVCALTVSCLALGLAVPGAAQPIDGIATLLEQVEQALASGDAAAHARLFSASVPREDVEAATADLVGPGVTRAVVRERDRAPLANLASGQGYRVIADVFLERGRRAGIATLRVDVVRAPAAAGSEGDDDGAWRLLAQQVLGRIDGLHRLALNPSKQFAVRDFTVTGEDVAVTFSSGSAFVVETGDGITGLVLLGSGLLRFSPEPAAERGQVRIFCGRDTLETPVTAAFVRVNPGEAAERFPVDQLVPERLDRQALRRAEEVFDTEVAKSFNLDLSDLSRERWSLVPGTGDLVIELRTRRYRTLTYARSSNESEDISLFDRARRRNISVYPSRAKRNARGPFYSEDDRMEYEVSEYDVDASYVPEREWIDARVRVRLRVRAGALSSITLRLHETLTIRSIVSEELGRLLALRVKGQNSILVGLPSGLARDARLTLTVRYAGRVPPQTPDREVMLPQEGQRDPRLMSDAPTITPEARYIYSNRSWWYPQPVVSQYSVAHMKITVPALYDVVATGDRSSDSPRRTGSGAPGDPARKTFVFYTGQPVRYLAFAVSRLLPVVDSVVRVGGVAGSDQGPGDETTLSPGGRACPAPIGACYDGVEISVLANPRQVGRDRSLVGTATQIIETYAGLLGDAPYPTFALTLLDNDLPGGHSPAYFAIVFRPLPTTPFSWRGDPVNFDSFPNFFLAHELAHQYWGQAVGWKSYHEQWLSEAFAQYFAALYAERSRGPGVFRDLLRQMRRSAIQYARQGPVHLGYRLGHIQGDSRVFRAIVYNKGAMVLHMLRRLVGDEAFFRALRAFYWESRFRKVGTDDLEAVFERATGRDLGAFFSKWILETGVPALDFSYTISPPAGRESPSAAAGHQQAGEAGWATVVFEQGGEPFEVPVTVTLTYASGEQEELVVPVSGPRTERRLPLRAAVRAIDANADAGALAEITGKR